MLIQLSQLKPNPGRDFKVDPIDKEAVTALVASISEDGFWGGVTARPSVTGGYEIAAGHHRIEAAKQAGLTQADIFVGEFDDQTMVRIYARENATQRSNKATAINGAVFAATKFIAKQLLTTVLSDNSWSDKKESVDIDGLLFSDNKNEEFLNKQAPITISGEFARDGDTSLITKEKSIDNYKSLFGNEKAFDIAQGTLRNQGEIGKEIIYRVLRGMPSITQHSIKESLATLHSSGDFARALNEVQQQIKAETEAARVKAEQLERQQKEADARAEEQRRKAEALEQQRRAAKEKEEADRLERERQQQEARYLEEHAKAKQAKAKKEQAEADLKRKETAAKASETVAKTVSQKKATFDLEGVSEHFKTPYQLETFRNLAEENNRYLPVKSQAPLAKLIKEKAKGKELTGQFIRDHFFVLLNDVRHAQRRVNSKEEEREFELKSYRDKDEAMQKEIAKHARSMVAGLVKMRESRGKAPTRIVFSYSQELRNAIESVAHEIHLLNKEYSL